MQLLLQTPSLLFVRPSTVLLGSAPSWAPLVLGSSESSRLNIGWSCNYMISCQVKQMVAVSSANSSLCDATPGHWIWQPFQSQSICPSWDTTISSCQDQCCPHAITVLGCKIHLRKWNCEGDASLIKRSMLFRTRIFKFSDVTKYKVHYDLVIQ